MSEKREAKDSKDIIEQIKALPDDGFRACPFPEMVKADTLRTSALKALVAKLEAAREALACKTSEASRLRKVLKECAKEWDTADNGRCAVCRIGHRKFDTKGQVQKCEWPKCLSHRIREALSHGDPCYYCGKEMNSSNKRERIENAIFGAHKECLEVEAKAIFNNEAKDSPERA